MLPSNPGSPGSSKRYRGGHFPNSSLPYHSTHSQNSTLKPLPPGAHKPPAPGQCPVPDCARPHIPRCQLHPVSWDEDMQRVVALSVSEYANNEMQCEVARHVIRDHPCVAKGGFMTDKTPRDRETARWAGSGNRDRKNCLC